MTQGAARSSDTVPVGAVSSSDNGPGQALPASARLENTLAEEALRDEEPVNKKEMDMGNNITPVIPIEETDTNQIEAAETASTTSASAAMECDEYRATKRKISRSAERYSSEDSEDENLKRVKMVRRRRILDEEQSKSNPDLTHRPSEEEPRIMQIKKGYISKQKRLEIEEIKEEIADKKREEIRRKKEEKLKEEEEKRKKEERIKAEANILARIGTKPTDEREYIDNMTASDLAAMALEYLDHVETIRTKCGTMQGALSGELKRRKISLDSMIKALQAKAEENGDPLFLRAKIEELLKKNREEDERKKREISELKEVVANLARENKEMRKELKLIRESIERKGRTSSPIPRRKESYYIIEDKKDTYHKDYPMISSGTRRCPSTLSRDGNEGPVMRPPLKGKSTPIPNSNLKQRKEISNEIKEKEKGKAQDSSRRKRTDIKIIENIQIRPPKEEVKLGKNKDEVIMDEDNMEWETNGLDWYEEVEKEKENEESVRVERNIQEDGNIQEKKNQQGKIPKDLDEKQEGPWIEVNKKKKKENNQRKEKNKSTPASKQSTSKIVKRKMPKTAAVSIKGDEKQGFSYAEVLRKARTQIRMEDLEIEAPRIRKGLNGATIIEISGPECSNKAQKLADKLQEILSEDKAIITTPNIKGELRIVGLEESISKEEIGWAIEEEGGCERKDIRIGEIKRTRRGMGVVWVQCPLKVAITIANKKKIKIGWSIVGVTLLRARPLQCYRCWHYGHVKDRCRSQVDRSKCCFQCGNEGHNAAMCNNAAKCAICTDLGRTNTHRVGSDKCEGVRTGPHEKIVDQVRRTDSSTNE